MPLLWLCSWAAGKWKQLAALAILGALVGGVWWAVDAYGDSRAAEAVVPWREAARRAADAAGAAQAKADADHARQYAATVEAARRFADAQSENARLAGVNRDLSRRLQDRLRARRDPVPAAAPDPAEPEPSGEWQLSIPVGDAFAGLLEFGTQCAYARDELAIQVNALIDAWPR